MRWLASETVLPARRWAQTKIQRFSLACKGRKCRRGRYGMRIGAMSAMRSLRVFASGEISSIECARDGSRLATWQPISRKQMPTCSKCGAEHDRPGKQSYCRACHAAYNRAHRKPLTAEQRRRDSSRSYAHEYLKRGILEQLPCEICGERKSQM